MLYRQSCTLFGLNVLRESSVEVLLSVFFRSKPRLLLKGLDKVALRRERQELRDVQARVVRMLEHVLGGFDLLNADEITYGYARFFLEKLREVRVIQAQVFREVRDEDAFLKMTVDIFDRADDMLTENVVQTERSHPGAVVLDALLLDLVELRRGCRSIALLDIDVRKRIGSFDVHAVVDAVSGDHGDGNDQVIADISQAVRGERADAAQLRDVIFSDLTHDFLQLSGRHKVIKVHLVLVRRAHHKMLSLHEKKPLEFFIYVLIHDCHPR